MRYKHFKGVLSLKSQLLIYFIVVALIPASIISIYHYQTAKSAVVKSIGESNYKSISHIMDNIDKQVEQANNLTDSLYVNTDVINLLQRHSSKVDIYDTGKKQAIESIAKYFEYMPVTNYILSLFIIGENGLDLRNGTEGSLINPRSFSKSEWFLKGKEAEGKIIWGSISPNYTRISRNAYVIPQYRTIKDLSNGRMLGYSVILFNQSIFSDCYNEVLLNKGERIYLADVQGNIISTSQPVELETNISDKQYFRKLLQSENQPYFEANIDNNSNLIIYKKSVKTGWLLIEIVPMTQIEEQKAAAEKTTGILLVSAILMCMLLSFYLSENFTRPIKTIVMQVNEIAQGNFDRPIGLNVGNEIGELGKSITKMKTDIKNLLQESVQKEREKRVAEIKMLQSQINPHFLYNTLNSIKLMAALQGSKGIENMVGSLGRILKAALGGVNDKISLREELSILDDYMYIQKIRYKGKIQFHKNVSDESLLNCRIIKFILQPIVENTVLHGLGPKDEAGEVILTVCSKGDKLVIEVCDNGIGMDHEKIKSIQESINIRSVPDKDKAIGLNNINQRLKLVYGEEYGLHFESKVGEYTKVTVFLPAELPEKDFEVG